MLRIAVLGPSEIAYRRFVPAILKSDNFEYVGVACALGSEWDEKSDKKSVIPDELNKAQNFARQYGGKIFNGYEALIGDPSVDAVYVPLSPGLHYKWGSKVVEANKHLLLEKPFTDSLNNTTSLLEVAQKHGVAVHENFAFIYHAQIEKIIELINSGEIGELRLIRTAFGFPYRGKDDFRYHRSMGGGALLDCGGYPIKLASLLLGGEIKVMTAALSSAKGHDVDVFGSATLENNKGLTAQISFGMDNSYKCELEIWGSKGTLFTSRVFTPTAEMNTVLNICTDTQRNIVITPDDQFKNSLEYFGKCIQSKSIAVNHYYEIKNQARLMDEIRGFYYE